MFVYLFIFFQSYTEVEANPYLSIITRSWSCWDIWYQTLWKFLSGVWNAKWEDTAGIPSCNLLSVVSLEEKLTLYICCAHKITSKVYWSIFVHKLKLLRIWDCLWINWTKSVELNGGLRGREEREKKLWESVKLPGMLFWKLDVFVENMIHVELTFPVAGWICESIYRLKQREWEYSEFRALLYTGLFSLWRFSLTAEILVSFAMG